MTLKVNLAELSLEKAERLVAEVQQHVNAAQQETREAHDAVLEAKEIFHNWVKRIRQSIPDALTVQRPKEAVRAL